jgi:multicomponent Na+:H+ antiporter subunit C
MSWLAHFNYWAVIVVMMTGLYMAIAQSDLMRKLIGITLLQTAVFFLYISFGFVRNAQVPILTDGAERYSNPLPHVLILTAIVVGVATTALGLALVVRIRERYGSIDEAELAALADEVEDLEPHHDFDDQDEHP